MRKYLILEEEHMYMLLLARVPCQEILRMLPLQTIYKLIKKAEEKYNFKMDYNTQNISNANSYYNTIITQGLA